jgi:hypothetical protein
MQYRVEKIIQSWPKDTCDNTMEIVLDEFGEPDEVTPSFLICITGLWMICINSTRNIFLIPKPYNENLLF